MKIKEIGVPILLKEINGLVSIDLVAFWILWLSRFISTLKQHCNVIRSPMCF